MDERNESSPKRSTKTNRSPPSHKPVQKTNQSLKICDRPKANVQAINNMTFRLSSSVNGGNALGSTTPKMKAINPSHSTPFEVKMPFAGGKKPEIKNLEGQDVSSAALWIMSFQNATNNMNRTAVDKAANFQQYLTGSAA